ncbi:hypothetical protein C4565_00915 [Candidatus Parcubacteria bacterium]|jgi:hypothetical protein|nr:MAG: hypothetical protein C4565_00915 [Candidatus Parcubacteria bacterium]
MKKIFFVIFLLLLFSPNKIFAQNILRGFGGKVVTSMAPPIVCSGGLGPITIIPSGIAPAAIYGTQPATGRFMNYAITPGGYVLGLYTPALAPICWIPIPPPGVPTPVYAFPIMLYGSSIPSTP